jgi:hypothetical protein
MNKQKTVAGFCDGCNKVIDTIDRITFIANGFCIAYENPAYWAKKGNCPIRNPGNFFAKSRGSINFLWKRLTDRKITRGHQTPGKQKGETCKTTPFDGYMAKSSRSYKHKNYLAWTEKMRRRVKGKL